MSEVVVVTSTTDSPEAVTAAMGGKVEDAPALEVETPSAAAADGEATNDDDDSETSEDKEQDTEEKPKPKGGFQRRIDKLTARTKDLERQLAERSAGQPQETKQETPAASNEKPKADTFDTYEEYVEALTDWKVDQKEQSRAKAETDRKQAEERQAVGDAWQNRIAEAKTRYSDFDDIVENDDIACSAAMTEVLVTSEHGADLAYWLGKNPAEAERIAKLSPIAAARELGRVEAGLKPASVATPKTRTSAAPAPLKPLGSKTTASTKKPEEMTYQEYKKYRENGGL